MPADAAGALTFPDVPPAMEAPHWVQNFAPLAVFVPHWVQKRIPRGVPQEAQKLPDADAPHSGQVLTLLMNSVVSIQKGVRLYSPGTSARKRSGHVLTVCAR